MLVLTAEKVESFEKYSVRVCQSKLAPAAPDNFIKNKCLFYQNITFNTFNIVYTYYNRCVCFKTFTNKTH